MCCSCCQIRLQDQDLTVHNRAQLKKACAHYFSTSSFIKETQGITRKKKSFPSAASNIEREDSDSPMPNLFVITARNKDDSPINQYESYAVMLWKLRDQVSTLSLSHPPREVASF